MSKNKLINFLILVLLYIGLSSLPFNLIIKNSNLWILICQCIVQIGIIIFNFRFIKKSTDFEIKKVNSKIRVFYFLPCFLACASNFLYFAFLPKDFSPNFATLIIPEIVLNILIAYNEETIFRVVFMNDLETKNELKAIVISASVFAICHITHFLSSFNPGDLIIVVYTFFLGLMLGMAYLYTRSATLTFVMHLLFNIVNKSIFESVVAQISNIWFYLLANAIVVIALLIYLVTIYLLRNKIKVETK